MQEEETGPGIARLLEGKRHEMVQIAQVRGDEDGIRMRPAVDIGIPHGQYLVCQKRGTGEKAGMCLRALRKVIYITWSPHLLRMGLFK